MDWGKLGGKVVSHGAKLLGGLLGGPPGIAAAAGAIVAEELGVGAEPEAVDAALENMGPEKAAKLREIEAHRELELRRLDVAALEVVNSTMRTEAGSEHWPQYSWRPFVGFLWPVTVLAVYVVLPLAGRPVPAVPEYIWLGWAAILGVATYDRGKQKRGIPSTGAVGVLKGLAGKFAG